MNKIAKGGIDAIHLGQMVERRVKDLGMNVSEFSRRMGFSRSNATSLFSRSDLYVKQLFQLGTILDFDFLLYLSKMGHGGLADASVERAQSLADSSRDLAVAQQELAAYRERVANLEKINALQDTLLRQAGVGSVAPDSKP